MLEDLSPPGQGFLSLSRRLYRAVGEQGPLGEPFVYDQVERRALDAVVIVPHFLAPPLDRGSAGAVSGSAVSGSKLAGRGPGGGPTEGKGAASLERYVYLRSAVRPPVETRDAGRSAVEEPEQRALWEAPAGLVEPDEESPAGIVRCARRELLEEIGFDEPVEAFHQLGPSTFPCPGVIAERHYFFHVEVDPSRQKEPTLDGSALEAVGVITAVPLREALRACREGEIADAKTELALRRLVEALDE